MFHLPRFSKYEDTVIVGLRLSLGLIFFWFGALKIAGYNPVFDIVHSTFPFFATEAGNVMLGAVETALGLGLLLNLFPVLVHVALVLHLLGTFAAFFAAPELLFVPAFPILSLQGEFVFKNVTLVMAGLAVLGYERNRKRRAN